MTAQPPVFIHPQLGPVTLQATELSDSPDAQVAETIDLMRQYAVEDSQCETVTQVCRDAYQTGEPIDDTFSYVRGRLAFQNDEATAASFQGAYQYPIVETLYRPRDLAIAPVQLGDCDDFSMLGAAMLLCQGVPVNFVTVGVADNDPDNYSHVYLACYPKTGKYAGRRIPLDLSHGAYPGWETGGITKIKEWPVNRTPDMILLAVALGGAYLVARAFKKGAN